MLVAQKMGWFMEGRKGLKGDADWISEEPVPSALWVDPYLPGETSPGSQDIEGVSWGLMMNGKHTSSPKPDTQQMAECWCSLL